MIRNVKVTWINASAGTGKTKALVDHCLNLLNQGVNPENILCITFTNNAVSEMQHRIKNNHVGIKTLHSVAQSIVQKIKGIQIAHILDSYDQEILLKKSTKKYLLENPLAAEKLSFQYSYEYFIALLKKVIYKANYLFKTFDAPTTELPIFKSMIHETIENEQEYFLQFLTLKGTIRKKIAEELLPEADNVFRHVQAAKIYEWMTQNNELLQHMNGIMTNYKIFKKGYDYQDLILEAIKLLDDPVNLYEATRNFQYILLDEAQDTSYHQWQLFQKIIENANDVLIVGDNKQNIYSFQEARPEFYDAFKEHVKNTSIFEEKTLQTNYRSLSKIVNYAAAQCAELTIPEQHVFRLEDGVCYTVEGASHILELLNSGAILPSTGKPITCGDILLLFRKRDSTFEQVIDFLEDQNIPLSLEKKMLFQDEPFIKELMHIIDLQIYYPDDLYDVFYYEKSELKILGLPMVFDSPESMVGALYGKLPDHLWDILIDVLSKIAAPTFHILREYLNHHPIHFDSPKKENAISVMTIHAAKGLQAPIVYLFETNSRTPHDPFLYDIKTNSLYVTPPSDIHHEAIVAIKEHHMKLMEDEKQRLLYVAITRACDQFYYVPYLRAALQLQEL